jgi:N-methylhydantoinase B
LSPAVHDVHELLIDSGGPGEFRGGLGVLKGARLGACSGAVMSYEGDRGRSITWGVRGGLPSIPMGVTVTASDGSSTRHIGAAFAGESLDEGDYISRPSAGGGGYGDPLRRTTDRVLRDVQLGYVSIRRAAADYGVVIDEDHVVDEPATASLRAELAASRKTWLAEDAEQIARRFHAGELDVLDLIRRYGVILDWRDGRLLLETTRTFRAMLARRTVPYWEP